MELIQYTPNTLWIVTSDKLSVYCNKITLLEGVCVNNISSVKMKTTTFYVHSDLFDITRKSAKIFFFVF